jgi:hypothetical protein
MEVAEVAEEEEEAGQSAGFIMISPPPGVLGQSPPAIWGYAGLPYPSVRTADPVEEHHPKLGNWASPMSLQEVIF